MAAAAAAQILLIYRENSFKSSPLSNPSSPTTSLTLPPLYESEVVNAGELIITNFIDGEVADHKRFAHTVLAALEQSISDSDIILARPLSIVPSFTRQTIKPRRKVVVSLSSASLVNKKMLAKTK